jgi:hypothetical protein
MNRRTLALCLSLFLLPAFAGEVEDAYPILAIPRGEKSDVLLRYKLNEREKALFKEMDAETAKLPIKSSLLAYHEVAARVGKRYGLSPSQGIAFFTRATFSEFEP